jgi:hypothetical protein
MPSLAQQRTDLQEIARICRKDSGWWSVDEYSRFAKEPLIEANAIRARRGDWSFATEAARIINSAQAAIYSRAK